MDMNKLRYSKDLKEIVEIRDGITSDEALSILCDELLGSNYYISDPVGGKQANAIIVCEILKKYKK